MLSVTYFEVGGLPVESEQVLALRTDLYAILRYVSRAVRPVLSNRNRAGFLNFAARPT